MAADYIGSGDFVAGLAFEDVRAVGLPGYYCIAVGYYCFVVERQGRLNLSLGSSCLYAALG